MFQVQPLSGTFSGFLKAGKYWSMSIFFLAKSKMLLILKPGKCGTWIVLSWLFFRCCLMLNDRAHLLSPWNYLCDVSPIGLLNGRQVDVCFELQQPVHLLLALGSYWNLPYAHPLLFHQACFKIINIMNGNSFILLVFCTFS